jgi:hypothetical protein
LTGFSDWIFQPNLSTESSNWIFQPDFLTESLQRLIATPTITRTMSSSQRAISIASNQMVSLPRVTHTSALTTQMTHNSSLTNLLCTALVIATISIQSLLDKRPTHLSQIIYTALMNVATATTRS